MRERKPWVSALTPEEAGAELAILGHGDMSREEVNAHWIEVGSFEDEPISVERSWEVAENYADNLASDHGLEDDDCLIGWLRKMTSYDYEGD